MRRITDLAKLLKRPSMCFGETSTKFQGPMADAELAKLKDFLRPSGYRFARSIRWNAFFVGASCSDRCWLAGRYPDRAEMIVIGFAQHWLAWHDRQRAERESSLRRWQIFWSRRTALAATADRIKGGLSSGEGFIEAVRDPLERYDAEQKRFEVVDPDGRALA